MVEYALLVALVAVIALSAVLALGGSVADLFCRPFNRHFDMASRTCVPDGLDEP